MNILMIGAAPNRPTDGVIVRGCYYLLGRSFPKFTSDYVILHDFDPQSSVNFNKDTRYDLIVVCGTPWLWDSFQNSVKYKNLLTCFNTHGDAKRLFLGIGSCLTLEAAEDLIILERKEEVKGIRELFSKATVICRDTLALTKLHRAGIDKLNLLPCPAYFCYGDEVQSINKLPESSMYGRNVLIFQDPSKSISKDSWVNPDKIKAYYDEVLDFYKEYDPDVYCTFADEVPAAVSLGLIRPVILRSEDHTLEVMRTAKRVLSGRIHCAIPAIVKGAITNIMPLDSRAMTITDWMPDKVSIKKGLEDYDFVLRNISPPKWSLTK